MAVETERKVRPGCLRLTTVPWNIHRGVIVYVLEPVTIAVRINRFACGFIDLIAARLMVNVQLTRIMAVCAFYLVPGHIIAISRVITGDSCRVGTIEFKFDGICNDVRCCIIRECNVTSGTSGEVESSKTVPPAAILLLVHSQVRRT